MHKTLYALLVALFVLVALSACGGPCTSCDGRSAGGQVMNSNNASQNVWHFLDQFDTTP